MFAAQTRRYGERGTDVIEETPVDRLCLIDCLITQKANYCREKPAATFKFTSMKCEFAIAASALTKPRKLNSDRVADIRRLWL